MNRSQQLYRIALVIALSLLSAIYLVQFMRPLHLESDSVCYLQIAERGAMGLGYSCPGCSRMHCPILYPPGYPWILAKSMRFGVAGSFMFVLLNYLSLVVALLAAVAIWRRAFALERNTGLLLCIVFLLSWPVFRLANTPLSEFIFTALAMTSLLASTIAFQATEVRVQLLSLGAALLLAVAAIEVRTVGIALLPAILWSAVGRPNRLALALRQFRSHWRAVTISGSVILVAGAAAVARSQYVTRDLRTQYSRGFWGTLLATWHSRLIEFGELTLNVPSGKLPQLAQPFFLALGAVAIAFICWLLVRRRKLVGPAEMFVLGVSGIMLFWPFKDPRFWIPVLPIFLGLIAWGCLNIPHGRAWSRFVSIGLVLFLVAGCLGEAYNTAISVSPNRFPFRFGDDYLGPVYRAAWGVRAPHDTSAVDSTALRILKSLEPRATSR